MPDLGHNHYTPGKRENWAYKPEEAREIARLERVRTKARRSVGLIWGAVLASQGDKDKARELIREAKGKVPGGPPGCTALARALQDL